MNTLKYEQLQSLVANGGVAVRVRQVLQPAGGVGDKVFPPTYSTGEKTLKYAIETRRVNGEDVPCVLLDSVASQANRMEEALLAAWEQEKIFFPVIGVSFAGEPELADLGTVTALQAPHRIADAILRDATDLDGKIPFRNLLEGQAFTDATSKNATAVFLLCPTALIFGVWDSTGPKGGLGAKFQRALTSEVVGINAQTGLKVGSRIDPLGIQGNVPIYHDKDNDSDWTIEAAQAKTEKGKTVPFSRKGAEGKGKASAVNHSNIPPTIDSYSGGVTFDSALQTIVLSLPALRKLRLSTDLTGSPIKDKLQAEQAARVALAALAIAGIANQRAQGYDLRSRCLLVADGPLVLELLMSDGTSESVSISVDEANALVSRAAADCKGVGLEWKREPVKLKPAAKLAALIRRSRADVAAGAANEDA